MIKTYLKTAIRSLAKNKFFSLINVLGLAIGISAALVIYLIVAYDFSFDQFEKDKERIYRVVTDFSFAGEEVHNSGVPYPLGPAVQKEVTGIEKVVPFCTWDEDTKVTVRHNTTSKETVYKHQSHIIYANADYFTLFGYRWLAGSPKTSLQQPYQVVLTESAAKQYYPQLNIANITGKEIIFNDSIRTTITGIVKDLTGNTDFTFTTFVSRATQESTSLMPGSWTHWNNTTSNSQLFVKLLTNAKGQHISKQLNNLFKKNKEPDPDDHSTTSFTLQPLSDIHFNSKYGTFDKRIAHKPTLYGLLAVAAFLLLLGSINFINLSTAQASQRAKETGIRKTIGSTRKQLIVQFLIETFLLTFIATLLSFLLAPLLLKIFADFIPEGLQFRVHTALALFMLLLIVVVGLLAGFYPALVLSSYKPILVLKNQMISGSGQSRNAGLRKILTVTQFVIAQVFIIATLLVSKQIHYSLTKDMGFKKEAILYFRVNYYNNSLDKKLILKNKLNAIPEIAMVSLANDPPSINGSWTSTMTYKKGNSEIETEVHIKLADTSYIKLYQVKLLAGTNLTASDTSQSFLINETYARVLGFANPQQAIGQFIEWDKKKLPVTGVIANFHQKSLHEIIKPLIITSNINDQRAFNIALHAQNVAGTRWKTAIGKIEKAWKEVYPEDDFEYHFVDDTIAKYYKAEQNISRLLTWATGLTIFISCLGLLGLVTYITHQRTKEIGVRKVIGATVTQIVMLLSKDFIKLVLVAFFIAVPVSWWGAHQWLQNFAYRTTISAWIFLAGGLMLLSMALLVLGIRTYKAAIANPVASLRSE